MRSNPNSEDRFPFTSRFFWGVICPPITLLLLLVAAASVGVVWFAEEFGDLPVNVDAQYFFGIALILLSTVGVYFLITGFFGFAICSMVSLVKWQSKLALYVTGLCLYYLAITGPFILANLRKLIG